MSETSRNVPRSDRTEDTMTVVSGWVALVLFVLGIHRLVSEGGLDWWARAALIFAFGLGIMWVWGYWPGIARWFRGWIRGGGHKTTAIAVALILSLVIINTLVRRRLPARWDLTQNQRFTLAPRTREILKSLDKPVRATVYLPGGRSSSRVRDVFGQYAEASDKFTWTYVDSLTNLNQILEDKIKISQDLTGARISYGDKHQDITEFTEKDITSAILKMTRTGGKTVYFLQGHGEMLPDQAAGDPRKMINELTTDLKDLQWKVETLNLFGKNVKVPDPVQAPVIVVAGPERELMPQEAKHLNDYLNKGGAVLLLLMPRGPAFTQFLKPWGIATTNDMVLDRSQEQGIVLVNRPESHPSMEGLSRIIFAPMHSVKAITPAPTGITVTELIKSGEFSITVPNVTEGAPITGAGAKEGPVAVAALAEKSLGTGDDAKKAQIAVVGDALFTSDLMIQQYSAFNKALSSSLINYLGDEQALVSIPPKDENTERAFVTPSQGRMLFLVHFLDFPLLALLLAILVYLKRR
jgi:ABC-type uncharacterized transport system involved in gliding motility auxiliary subunit